MITITLGFNNHHLPAYQKKLPLVGINNMKNILVPTDFSDCALRAAQAAMSIAAKFSANIHFLHIMPDPDGTVHVPHLRKGLTQHPHKGYAQSELALLVEKARQLGLTATPVLVFDKGNERIENYIKPLEIDLIVMGSHGATGIRELVLGSNTQRVVRKSLVPVLVIKNWINDPFKVENILFASTFIEDTTNAFEFVAQLARIWKATLHILFINFIDKVADQSTIDQLMRDLTQPYPDISFTNNSVIANDEEFGIHQVAEKIGADMIALTTHDKTGFFLSHSVVEDLVNHEEISILAINNNF
jgi:nucleotide-binding universal stress UspA family protein